MKFTFKKTEEKNEHPEVEIANTIIEPEHKKSWFNKFFNRNTEEDNAELRRLQKQIETERDIMRQEEKEKLYKEFDIDALFVDPVEEGFFDKYLPIISVVLSVIIILIVAIKK